MKNKNKIISYAVIYVFCFILFFVVDKWTRGNLRTALMFVNTPYTWHEMIGEIPKLLAFVTVFFTMLLLVAKKRQNNHNQDKH
jgi:hypothetical protein